MKKYILIIMSLMFVFSSCSDLINNGETSESSSSEILSSSSSYISSSSSSIDFSSKECVNLNSMSVENNTENLDKQYIEIKDYDYFYDYYEDWYDTTTGECLNALNCDVETFDVSVNLSVDSLSKLNIIDDSLTVSMEFYYKNLPTLILCENDLISNMDFERLIGGKIHLNPDSIKVYFKTSKTLVTTIRKDMNLTYYAFGLMVNSEFDSLDLSIDEMNEQIVGGIGNHVELVAGQKVGKWITKLETKSNQDIYVYNTTVAIEERFNGLTKNTTTWEEHGNPLGDACVGLNMYECYYKTDYHPWDFYTLNAFYWDKYTYHDDYANWTGHLNWKIWDSWPADVDWYNGE